LNVLITGGAGFIGSYLAEEWLKKNAKVTVIDNLSTGKKENIIHLKKNKKFHFVRASITRKKIMHDLIRKSDIIYHLAAVVGVNLVVNNPIETIKTNVFGTSLVLELASKYKKRIFIASSSEVYGKTPSIPLEESSDRLIGPTQVSRWSYSCSKAIDEFLALGYSRKNNLAVTITRLFNTVGPRQTSSYGMVIPRFVKQALSNKPITVYGDGTQSRCFAYVRDVVKCLVKLSNIEGAIGEIFNVGSQEEITIKNLAKKIKKISKSKSKIVYIPYKEVFGVGFEDVKRRVPDVSKLKRILGFIPNTKLDIILEEVIDYEKEQVSL